MACCKKRKQALALRKKRVQRMKQLNEIKQEKMKQKARDDNQK
jgi:hypothetical protein